MAKQRKRRVNLGDSPATCNPYRDVLRIAWKLRKAGYLKSFKGDLVRHDKRALKGHCGPYVWAIREGGTHLATPESVCYWKNNRKAWDNIASGRTFGGSKIFFSPGNGKPPRPVGGTAPGKIVDKWERSCQHTYDPWTGKQLSGAGRRRKRR